MSLVEKALKKLQENRQQQAEIAPPMPVSIAKIVEYQKTRAGTPDSLTLPSPSTPSRVVQVDRAALRTTGFLPPDHQEREIADQYRSIKRGLIRVADEQAAGGSNPRRAIMLTSALPGDGKTFTCINLAFSLSLERDWSVILVDGDVAKPHLSTLFGIADEPGLLDVLADPNRDIASVILPTNVSNLFLVSAGTRSDEASELMASNRMAEILGRLISAQSKVMVVFDSPPMLMTSEARALAGSMGQVVVVVKADVTPQQAVLDTVEILGKTGSISLVLNQVPVSTKSGYYYGYAYGATKKSAGAEQPPEGATQQT